MGTGRPEEVDLSERMVEGEKGVHCGWTGFGSLESRGWDIPSSVSGLGKGQEMKIHIDYVGDPEGVGK